MSEDLSAVHFGPYQQGDEVEILKTFNRVFDQNRTAEFWNWQYRDNPEGIHCFLAKLSSGRIVSQFTGIPRRMKVRDDVRCFGEIVDSFTDPEFRVGLKKPGLFATTCYHFVDHFGRADREVIMYGLPNPPAFRVGRALLGYVHLYDVQLLTRKVPTPNGACASSLAAGLQVERLTRFPAEVDALQAALAAGHQVMTIRDSRYLNWRYASRPGEVYEMLAFREEGARLLGLAVLRHRWLDQPVTAAAELFLERDHPLAPAAVAATESAAGRAGSERLQVMCRPESPEWMGLGALGFEPEPTRFRLVARTYDREQIPLSWLKDAWYVSLGDFDVV